MVCSCRRELLEPQLKAPDFSASAAAAAKSEQQVSIQQLGMNLREFLVYLATMLHEVDHARLLPSVDMKTSSHPGE